MFGDDNLTHFRRHLQRWFHYGLCLSVTLSVAGCRTPWGTPAATEPSFDRLLELENSSSSNLPAEHPMVSQRRPGNTAAARFADPLPPESNQLVANDLDEQNFDEETANGDDDQMQLLRRTQFALSRSEEQAPEPNPKSLASKSKKRALQDIVDEEIASDDDVVFRLSDGKVEQSRAASRRLADHRRTESDIDEDMLDTADAPAVMAASHTEATRHPRKPSPVPEMDQPVQLESLTWEQHLREALQQLQQDSGDDSLLSPEARVRQQFIQRVLSLSLNDREGMLEAIDGLQTNEQDYLSYELSALFDAMDPEANPVSGRKWSLVMLNQRKANTHLAALSNLEINNMAFCTEVIDFGVVSAFDGYNFAPEQEVLLYLELDNFISEKSADGKSFETQLQGSYEIVDASGRRVADQLLPADSHLCKNARRDYFIAYRIYMPPKISAGSYTLKLTIEDLKGRKFGQSDIQFKIQ